MFDLVYCEPASWIFSFKLLLTSFISWCRCSTCMMLINPIHWARYWRTGRYTCVKVSVHPHACLVLHICVCVWGKQEALCGVDMIKNIHTLHIYRSATCIFLRTKTTKMTQSLFSWTVCVTQIQSVDVTSFWNGARKTRQLTSKWMWKILPSPGVPAWLSVPWSTTSGRSWCESCSWSFFGSSSRQ